jgi:hypothetical protein
MDVALEQRILLLGGVAGGAAALLTGAACGWGSGGHEQDVPPPVLPTVSTENHLHRHLQRGAGGDELICPAPLGAFKWYYRYRQ